MTAEAILKHLQEISKTSFLRTFYSGFDFEIASRFDNKLGRLSNFLLAAGLQI